MDRDRIEGRLEKTEGKLTDDKVRETQGKAEEKWARAKQTLREMRRDRERHRV